MKLKQKIIVLLFVALATMISITYAKDETIYVLLNGQKLHFDVSPTIIEDRVMVPFRSIMEEFGLEIEWEQESNKIVALNQNLTITLVIGQKEALCNNRTVVLDVAPTIIDGRTLIPLRFISEQLGAEVSWDENINTVFINQYPLRYLVHHGIEHEFKASYINEKGEVVIPPLKGGGNDFKNGYASISKSENAADSEYEYYYIDTNGKNVDESIALSAQNTSQGVVVSEIETDSYLIDLKGKKHDFQNDVIFYFADKNSSFQPDILVNSYFSEGLICYVQDGLCGYMDRFANVVIKPQYKGALPFQEGLASVTIDGDKKGYINHNGEMVIAPKFESAYNFSEGLARVRVDGKEGFIDKSGKVVIPAIYQYCNDFSEGLCVVHIDGKDGFIDKSGNLVIEAKYGMAKDFAEGVAAVVIEHKGTGDNLWGYIDKNGNYVLEKKYSEAYNFNNGVAQVLVQGLIPNSIRAKKCYINKKGDILAEGDIIGY